MSCIKRYECTLSPKLLEKAVKELNEPRDNEKRLQAIDELRNNYDAEKFGPLVREDDEFFLRFLRAKKFNQKKALTVLQNYHNVKKEFKEVFGKVNNPAVLTPIIEKEVMMMLPGVAKNGAAVMLSRHGLIDKDMDIYDFMAYGVFSMEKLLEDEAIQINGIATIKDLENFNMTFFTKISPLALGKMTKVWQEAMPMRYKESHVVNEGTFYDVIMAIVRPFLKKKLLDRIHLHGTNFKGIHEFIDPSILPPYLDGTGPDPDGLAKLWGETLMEDMPQDTAL
ncbi:unnamed protein product [Clavelina lepadiformis]|uniref:CRAL-TRIO domain-containing protein n=1 Tax=Clavelina lepadiformis TaxID=159417 RepID=A0ABP0F5N3_CLALP